MKVGVLLQGGAEDQSRARALAGQAGYALCSTPSTWAGLDALIVQRADALPASSDAWRALLSPLEADRADVVIGRRANLSLLERGVNQLAALTMGGSPYDVGTNVIALRGALATALLEPGTDLVGALIAAVSRSYRLAEVPLEQPGANARSYTLRTFNRFRALLGTGSGAIHDGHATLESLEGAGVNYNAWLGERFRQYAGERILEVGAGLGTITAQLARHAQHVVALELEPAYVERLRNRFRGQPNVVPTQSSAELADWRALEAERLDTVVMSNVLEHLRDDVAVLTACASLLGDGGRMLLYVPALPQVFGTLDTAVGHYRRYTPATLRAALDQAGFEVERLDWHNVLAIPGWFVNGRVLKRTVLSPLQLRLYDMVAPLITKAEGALPLPVGLNLFCVARRRAATPASPPRPGSAP